MKKLIIILAAFTLAGCSDSISDFQTKNFIKFFGTGDASDVSSVIETSGGYIFTGYDSRNSRKQIYMAKTDIYGNTLWSNTIESDSIQEGLFIKEIDDASYIVVGSSQTTSTSNNSPMIMQVSNSGEVLWTKYINNDNNLQINDIAIIDQTLMLAGESYKNGASTPNYFAANYTINGDMVWQYTSVGIGAFKKIYVNNQKECYLIGNDTYSALSSITINKLTASNPISDIPRKITFEDNFDGIVDVKFKSNCLYILIDRGNLGAEVLKLDENFNDVWTSTPLSSDDASISPKSLALRYDNSIMVCGEYNNSIHFIGINPQGTSSESSLYRTFYGTATQIMTTNDGGLLIAGSTSETYYQMMQIIKTDSELYLLNE